MSLKHLTILKIGKSYCDWASNDLTDNGAKLISQLIDLEELNISSSIFYSREQPRRQQRRFLAVQPKSPNSAECSRYYAILI